MDKIYLFGMAVAAALLLLGCAGGNAETGAGTGTTSGTSLGTGDVGLDSGGVDELPPLTDEGVGTASADEVAGDASAGTAADALSASDLGLESGNYTEPDITQGEADMEPVEPF
ncbi:hypothetical protein AUJ17_03325 [Candidatus Micrarchaeota archaeon CG1_02_47_40]|nr:MAG: hypothetical protein AUJ17_03325 [Candidatus Micrarchaeota archaeon CG1_02_47_40]